MYNVRIRGDIMLTSTRKRLNVLPSEAVVKGISQDGGLFIFENAEDFVFDKSFLKLDYLGLAERVLSFVFDDFDINDIRRIISNAYSKDNFDVPVDLKTFDKISFLELWHGPTHAFKDMALTILGHLMVQAKKNVGDESKTLVLTATSGDTGSATLSGFAGTGIEAIVLYPHGGVSPVQEAQMQYFAQNGSKAIAVEQNFDFCQTLVKKVFTDKNVELENAKFSSANSINIGRLVPQIVYYFHSYLELCRNDKINFGDKINFSVPTGNFGNILAGYIASKMGLPVNKFICASNKNDVLTDFFNTGVYDRKREFFKTISPSMDILVSSNLERLLYLASDCDYELVSSLMKKLNDEGKYEIPQSLKEKLSSFVSYSVDDANTKVQIKKEFEKNNYLIDPYTAVALGAAEKYVEEYNDGLNLVVVSTASPYKFPEPVCESLGLEKGNNIFETIEIIESKTGAIAPKKIKALKNYQFNRIVWSSEEAEYKLRKISGDKNV